MKIRIGYWEQIIRRTPPKTSVAALGGRRQSFGKKKVATSGRSAL